MSILIYPSKLILSAMVIGSVILFGSCTKEKKGKNYTAVYGKLLDYYTLEPAPVSKIVIKDGLVATGFLILDPMATNMSDSTYSDENGYFYIELKDHFYNAQLGISTKGYYGAYLLDDYQPLYHLLKPGIYPDYIIRLKPIEDE